jgi:hypothetical protein
MNSTERSVAKWPPASWPVANVQVDIAALRDLGIQLSTLAPIPVGAGLPIGHLTTITVGPGS